MGKNNCISLTNYEDIAVHAIFHVLILIIVLTAFFFIVVENIERKSLSDQLINGIKNGLKDVKMEKNSDVYNKLTKLSQIYNKPDSTNVVYNNSLYMICIGAIVTLSMVLITLLLTLKFSSGRCVRLLDIILENMLLFICVGVVEYIFFINIGMKFVPIKPSYIAELINNTINN